MFSGLTQNDSDSKQRTLKQRQILQTPLPPKPGAGGAPHQVLDSHLLGLGPGQDRQDRDFVIPPVKSELCDPSQHSHMVNMVEGEEEEQEQDTMVEHYEEDEYVTQFMDDNSIMVPGGLDNTGAGIDYHDL